MRERDEDGRPVPTHNAGAFLSPVGMIPAPSSMLDDPDDVSTIVVSESDIERQGQPVPTSALATRARLSGRPRWLAATGTSVAVWALFAVGLRWVLAATEPWSDVSPLVPGHHLMLFMHTDVFWFIANTAFLVIGTWFGVGQLASSGWRVWSSVAAGSLLGAVSISASTAFVGDLAVLAAAAGAIVWLLVARRILGPS